MEIGHNLTFMLWLNNYSGLDGFDIRDYSVENKKEIKLSLVCKTEKVLVHLDISLDINNPQDFEMQLFYPVGDVEFYDVIHDKIAEWSASLKDKYIIHQLSI